MLSSVDLIVILQAIPSFDAEPPANVLLYLTLHNSKKSRQAKMQVEDDFTAFQNTSLSESHF